jgi:hypothetical protein
MPDPGADSFGGLAKAGPGDYLGAMSVFPPVSGPRALWADLKLFWSTRTRVQWVAGTLAILIPIGLGFAFWLDGRTNIAPGPRLILIESWPANRTAAETRANVEQAAAERARREAATRADFQQADNALNSLGL